MTRHGRVNWRRPSCDIYESPAGMTIFADVPGARRQDLAISIEGNQLVLETRSPAAESEGQVPHYRRTFALSNDLDRDAVRAQLQDGVLRLTLPMRAESAARSIEIEE